MTDPLKGSVVTDQTSGEPLAPAASISAIVSAVITLLVAFGVQLTVDQVAAILGFTGVAGPLAVWYFGRKHTVPANNVVAVVNKEGDVVASNASDIHNGAPVDIQKSLAA